MTETTQTDITDAFFERLAQKRYEPLLHMASGSIQWIIEGAGSWIVNIKNGSVIVSKELALNRDTPIADCVLECSKEDFERMVKGEQNPYTLMLQMRMKCTGNIALFQMFQRLFPDESLVGASIGR